MAKAKPQNVEQFLEGLSHPRKADIEQVWAAILQASPGITEQVKWSAPSFCINGDDRITFRLQPRDVVELVFHRGAKKRDDASSFSFDDPSGLIKWSTSDRGIIAFPDHDAVQARLPALVDLVDRWMKTTAD